MTIKTFDPNRVGGGTFQLEQDATGAYTIKEVGFVKLPDLKLPEINQAAYTAPPDSDDDTTPDPCPPGFKLVDGVCQRIETSSGGGGGGGQQDFTGESMYKNIKTEATGGNTLMESAQKFSGQDTGIQVENLTKDPEQNRALLSYNQALKVYNDAVAKTDTSNPNEMKNVDEAKALVDKNREFYEKSVAPGGLFFEGTMEDAPIGDFSQGPRTVPTGTLTGAKVEDIGKTFRSDTDKFKTRFDPTKIEPAEVEPSIMEKAKKIVDNSLVVTVAKGVGSVLRGIVGESTATQKVNKSLFKTRGDLGSSVDPGRIAGNPTTDLYEGMNRNSAYGNLERAGNKRIETREKTIARKGVKSASNPNGVSQDFVNNTNNMKRQSTDYKTKKRGLDTSNPNEMKNYNPDNDGGDKGSDSGKSIVCTAMYQTTGLQDWAKAMKIWYIYQKRYLTIQHQEGYHKLFKPFVKGMHKSNIIKIIGAHFAKHRTQHLKHVMFNSKPSLLGKIYNKILEPICYWAGRK